MNEEKTKKVLKISFKQAIIIAIVVIALIILIGICMSKMFSTKTLMDDAQEGIEVGEDEEYKKTYELNKLGLYKSSDILEEKYNNNGDLIYIKQKMNNGNIDETSYNYEYDSKNRVTKLLFNTDSYLQFSYTEDDKFSEIKSVFGSTSTTTHKFVWENGEYPIIIKSNSITGYSGYLYFEEKDINNQKYILSVEVEKNNKIGRTELYKKYEGKVNNIFEKIGYAPLEYMDMSYSKEQAILYVLTNYNMVGGLYSSINHGQEIMVMQGSDITSYTYDNKGRILLYASNGLTKFYKYEEIDENTWNVTSICKADNEYSYNERKVYKENGIVTKIKEKAEERITEYKYNILVEEYQDYVSQNKVNDDISAMQRITVSDEIKKIVEEKK